MSSIRSIGLAAACLGAIASILPSQLHAQEWPTRPVKIVVAFAPGGSADQLGRLLAAELSTAFRTTSKLTQPWNSTPRIPD